jgi:TonB-linked SusC/RagA family outer membrane protein
MYIFSNGMPSVKKAIAGYEPLEALIKAPKCWTRKRFTSKTLVRAVKLTATILFIACMQVSARTNAQRLSIDVKNVSLQTLFSEIEKRTPYVFFYDEGILKGTRPVTVDMRDASVEEVLQTSLHGQALNFAIHDRTIFIKKEANKPASIATIGEGEPPTGVAGIVRSEAGVPLAGATVFIKKLNKSGVTNTAGEFVLKNVPNGEYEVEISYIGYEAYRTKINVVDNQATILARLKQSENNLDQTVVKGYYATTNRLNTGDVTTIKSEDLAKQPVANPLAALEGRVPGLVITQTTGAPGGGFKVQIRGQNSLLNGNDPFYVIDGVPYNSQIPALKSTYKPLINPTLQGGNPLNFINISDIESIVILKDADATSIYGSRAANGAILITTKKGKEGKTKIDLNAYTGIGQTARQLPMLNTQQYLQMRREAFSNDNVQPTTTNAPDLLIWDTARYTDWQKVLTGNNAHYADAQASISGGTANTQYIIGANYHRETAVYPTIIPDQGVDQKGSAHLNLTTYSNDRKLRVTINASYLSDLNTVQAYDLQYNALNLSPDAPALYNPDGSLNWAPVQAGQAGTWNNPYSNLYQKYRGRTSNLVGNSVISYSVLPGLDIKTSLGYTNMQTDEILTTPSTIYDPSYRISSGSSQFNNVNSHSWIVEPEADYNRVIGAGQFSALVGMTFQENNNSVQTISASGFLNDALLENLQSAAAFTPSSVSTVYKYNAVFGRLNYNWQSKYIVNLTGRHDGSSRFGPGQQFANFGAVGAAWIFSNEDFFKRNVSFISFGKLRGSYGTSGNDQIGDYRFIDLYTTTTNPYQGIQGLYPNSLFNTNLAWELDKKIEGGLELGLLRDRIMINASYFRSRSGNQLVTAPLSLVTGFSSIPSNLPAVIQNTGVEIMVTTTNIKSKNFNWASSINLTIPRNKLVAFPNQTNSVYANLFVVGQPVSVQKVYHVIGVNDTTGVYQFSGSKGPTYDPVSNVDNTTLINTAPRYYGGFQNNIQYKGFNLDFLFQFVKQTGMNIYTNNFPGSMFNEPSTVLNRWQKQGDIKPFQKFSQNYSGNAYNAFSNYLYYSDFAYSDASFIRLKNVSLSYSFPQALRQKWHLQNLRIFAQGQNLLTITKYKGIDPETQGTTLPPLRVWTGGFQITL